MNINSRYLKVKYQVFDCEMVGVYTCNASWDLKSMKAQVSIATTKTEIAKELVFLQRIHCTSVPDLTFE